MAIGIGKTPAIDEIVISTLIIPIVSPDINPLDALQYTIDGIQAAINKDETDEIAKYYQKFSDKTLKAALEVAKCRQEHAYALQEYLYALYEESAVSGNNLTPHEQIESTPRFNINEIKDHLKFYLMQGTEDDLIVNNTPSSDKKEPKLTTRGSGGTLLEKTLNNTYATCYLLADKLISNTTSSQYRKSDGDININALSDDLEAHANYHYPKSESQSPSSIRDRLKKGKDYLSGEDDKT